MDLAWHSFYAIGHEAIDRDHQHLLMLMVEVQAAIEAHDFERCSLLLGKLLDETRLHFQREEALLAELGYPELDRHHHYHEQLLVYVRNLKSVCESAGIDEDPTLCFQGMARFMVDDILRGDLQFKSFLEHRGAIPRTFAKHK